MIALQARDNDVQPTGSLFVAFPTQSRVPDDDIHALITDFFLLARNRVAVSPFRATASA